MGIFLGLCTEYGIAAGTVGSIVGIVVGPVQIYLGAACIDYWTIQPMIPKWLLGELAIQHYQILIEKLCKLSSSSLWGRGTGDCCHPVWVMVW